MNYSELLQLAKGWSNFIFYRTIIWRLLITQNYSNIRTANLLNFRQKNKEAIQNYILELLLYLLFSLFSFIEFLSQPYFSSVRTPQGVQKDK